MCDKEEDGTAKDVLIIEVEASGEISGAVALCSSTLHIAMNLKDESAIVLMSSLLPSPFWNVTRLCEKDAR